jgi:hypothetical protein
MRQILKKLVFLLTLFLLTFSTAFAQDTPGSNRPPIIPAGSESTDALKIPHTPAGQVEEQYIGGSLLPSITRTVIAAAAATAVLFIIIGGIQILTAYGADDKVGKGKKTITWAIVGLLISILSYAIVTIISSIKLQ